MNLKLDKIFKVDNGTKLKGSATVIIDDCFVVTDIAKYLSRAFAGKSEVPLQELWDLLDDHPIFPSDGFRNEIKADLKNTFGATIEVTVNPQTFKKGTVVSFPKGFA